MRVAVIIDLDEAELGDAPRFPVIADLLHLHADDLVLVEGSAPVVGGRIAYGTHVVSHRVLRDDSLDRDPPTFRSEDIPEFLRRRREKWAGSKTT